MCYDFIYFFYLGAITNHYIGFCDDRHINPVDGDISEILFYLDYVYPKTLVKAPDNEKIIEAKILPILNVLDKIHDPYEGEDLSGHDLVAEHIQGIFSMHEFVFIDHRWRCSRFKMFDI